MSRAGSMETWVVDSLVLALSQSNALGSALSGSMHSTVVYALKTTETFQGLFRPYM